MDRYIITGKKSRELKKDYNTTLKPVERKEANLEAEKGETAVTITNPSSNIFEFFKIGGKKHSQGGTPLNLQAGNDNGDGASFIFSDTPSMKIKDPNILKFFNMDPKKPVTPAKISMQYLPIVNDAKFALMDEELNNEAKTSHTKNLDNAAFKIAALALYQESKKGMPNGYSSVMQPFFNKTNIDPAELFSVNNQDAEKVNTVIMSAFGGDSSKDNKSSKNIDLKLPVDSQEKPLYNINGYAFRDNGVMGAGINPSVNFGNASINPYLNVIGNQDFRQTNYGVSGNYNITPNFSISGGFGNDGYNAGARFQFATGGQLKKYNNGGPNSGLKEIGVQYDIPDYLSKLDEESKKATLEQFNNKPELANQYLYISSLAETPGFQEALYSKYQKAADNDNYFGRSTIGDKKLYKDKKPVEVLANFIESQRRHLKLKAYDLKSSDIGKKHDYGNTTKYLNEFASKLNESIPEKETTAAEQLAYLAFDDLVKDQNNKEYSPLLKGVLSPFEAVKEGEGDETTRGVKGANVSRADGIVGDTWALQTARFKEKKAIEPTPSKESPRGAIPYQPLTTQPRPEVPFDFRREDKASIQRAIEAKNAIQKYMPWAKVPGVTTTESAYFSPERAIAATNEQLAQGIAGVNAFATPQQAAAAITQMQGKAFGQVADVIGNYADKNVGIFNQTEQQNTALANSAAQQAAQMQTSNYDKQTIAKQQYNNSLQAAKDKITQLTNQAWTNASNIFNLNKIQKQFIKDPYTGLITKFSDKPQDVSKQSSKDLGQEFMDFKKTLVGVSDDTAARLFTGLKDGKYEMKKESGQIEDNASTSTTSENSSERN